MAAVGLVLLLGALGYLVHDALNADGEPPDIVVIADSIRPMTDDFLVEIRVVNRGSATAARVVVEGALHDATSRVESSQITIDYVPLRSERTAGLLFTQDPRRLKLRLRVQGYEVP